MIRRLSKDPGRLTLVASGAFGLWAGLAHAEWQWAVEFAQMGAGLVQQPADNPFSILHAKLWSLISQLTTLALAAGMSERMASWALSGLAGMVTCQALAMLAFACCRRFWASVSMPAVVLFSGITMHDGVYPVMLLGWQHTFGMFGLSATLLAVGLIGSGFRRTGAVLLGSAVAMHTSTGAPTAVFAVVAAVFSWRDDREGARALVRYLVIGFVISGVSFAVHAFQRPPIPAADPDAMRRFLIAWTTVWDEHRRPVEWSRLGALINLVLPLAMLAWLPVIRDSSARIAIRLLVIATLSSLPLAALSNLPPDLLPSSLIIVMPARLLNIGLFASVPILVGLLAGGRTHVARWTSVAAAGLVVISSPSALYFDQTTLVITLGVVTILIAFLERHSLSIAPGHGQDVVRRPAVTLGAAAVGAALVVLFVLPRSPLLADARTDFRTAPDPVLDVAATREGRLATAGDLSLVQLKIRRPVLIDGLTLDSLPYSIESGPIIDRILKDVYDMDLLHPPAAARRGGRIPNEPNRDAWERFDLERWRRIRERYDVRDVLTFGSWRLALPLVVASPDLRLYTIPIAVEGR
jgi:hypothetical protein